LDIFFSTLPSVAEGFQLKTWRGGPDAAKPKLSPIAKGLIARGLMRLDASGHLPRLFFTEAGLTALRAMMMDHRLADPKKFAHVSDGLPEWAKWLVPLVNAPGTMVVVSTPQRASSVE
jgi:hypothetical protein